MAKHRSRSNRDQGPSEKSLTVELPLPVLGYSPIRVRRSMSCVLRRASTC